MVKASKDNIELVCHARLGAETQRICRHPVSERKSDKAARTPLGEREFARSLHIGEAELPRSCGDVALMALGHTVLPVLSAATLPEAKGIDAAAVNARFVKPPDARLIRSSRQRHEARPVKENVLAQGFGSALLELFLDREIEAVHRKRDGTSDTFVEQGHQNKLRKKYFPEQEGI